MEESSRESPPKCQCGFWGSADKLGLCSVCYREVLGQQAQGTASTVDGGKPACQTHSNNQVKKMDSKHCPSRSATDNLPSSLSSPGGERSTLETTAQAANGGTTASHLPPTTLSSSGAGETAVIDSASQTLSCEPSLGSEDADQCSIASSDSSYDTKREVNSYASDSYSSLHSMSGHSLSTKSSCVSTDSSQDLASSDSTLDIQESSTQLALEAVKTLGLSAQTAAAVTSVLTSAKNAAMKASEVMESPTEVLVSSGSNSQSSAVTGSETTPASANAEPAACQTSGSVTPGRGVKRTYDEMDNDGDELPAPSPPPQKNKKRCFSCSCRLELAQRTIGKCRCDRIFCARHRLPEQHECDFNHKEDGRREAREKMVKPPRHLGPSYRREDNS